MDQKIFNRSYLLSVVEKRDSGIVAAQPDIPDYEVEGFTTEPTYGRYNQFYEFTITDLQIVAEIDNSSTTKKAGASVNQIIIYNLDEDTRSKVCKEGNYVTLRAGYGYGNKQDLPIIFSGQVQRATSQKQNSDYVSVLLCKEGYDSMKYIRISKSMKSLTVAEVAECGASTAAIRTTSDASALGGASPPRAGSVLHAETSGICSGTVLIWVLRGDDPSGVR